MQVTGQQIVNAVHFRSYGTQTDNLRSKSTQTEEKFEWIYRCVKELISYHPHVSSADWTEVDPSSCDVFTLLSVSWASGYAWTNWVIDLCSDSPMCLSYQCHVADTMQKTVLESFSLRSSKEDSVLFLGLLNSWWVGVHLPVDTWLLLVISLSISSFI